MGNLTNTTLNFLKRFDESLAGRNLNKEQAERIIIAIANGDYELSHNEKIIVISDLKNYVERCCCE